MGGTPSALYKGFCFSIGYAYNITCMLHVHVHTMTAGSRMVSQEEVGHSSPRHRDEHQIESPRTGKWVWNF